MSFEFDPDKEKLNIQKHGLDFNSGSQIFKGSFLEMDDTRKDYGEQRIQAIGEYQGIILFIATHGEKKSVALSP